MNFDMLITMIAILILNLTFLLFNILTKATTEGDVMYDQQKKHCSDCKLLFFFILQVVKSSIVYDGHRQEGVYVNDFCPNMKYCAEGTHVMCMYYNPQKEHGPKCSNSQNVTITPILVERLLEVANAIRSKIARGKEKGKNDEFLPRGYGIFRLSWDKELATFAQVLANQCVLKHDICRATKRFPDPGQTAGIARFSYPDWLPIGNSKNFSTPGFGEDQLQYAVTQNMKTWYFFKRDVEKEMISNFPDWTQHPSPQGRHYLQMVYGSATHMGCGISAYTDYTYYENKKSGGIYNLVEIICNFSARPRTGGAVYNTVPPGDTETPFSKCGCPVGSEGDSECLCVINEPEKEDLTFPTGTCVHGSCDPTVVILPIFTMEDTPPDHLFRRFSNSSVDKSAEIGDIIFDGHEHSLRRNDNRKYLDVQIRHFNTLQQTDKKISVRKRNYDKNDIETKSADTRYSRQSLRTPSKHVQKKSSIFTRATRFSLPTTRSRETNKEYGSIHPIIRDVVPRKDFTDAKKLVDKYIYGKSSLFKPIARKSLNENDIHNTHEKENGNNLNEIIKAHINEEALHVSDIISHNTESSLSLIEQNVVHHDDFVKELAKDSIFNQNESIQSISQTTDNKLMNLLDTLEREVKHIELKDKDKEIFDEKIRKIYGKVVGKPVEALGIKLTIPDDHESKSHHDDHLEKRRADRRVFNEHSDIPDKHELLKEKNDLSFELFDDSTATNHHNVQRKVRDRSLYRNHDIENGYGNKNSYRNIEHNDIESHEHKYDDFDFNYRKDPYNRDHYSRKSLPRHDNRDDHKSSHKNYYLNHDGDPLSIERRKYYQDKLDNIERRLNRVRNHKRRTVTDERHTRAMLTPHARKSENQIDSFYIPDRARFLHGY